MYSIYSSNLFSLIYLLCILATGASPFSTEIGKKKRMRRQKLLFKQIWFYCIYQV